MMRINLARHPLPSGLTCFYFPIYFNDGRNFIWVEVYKGITPRYSLKKIKDVVTYKEN